ncbi:hypothetical protein AQUCO_00900472v1 [Aquilegia coerulea]|uniref:ATP-dependent DNA helicase n=1 Tax=Aquilegia coerulea TaxID=218851 RepID=A0A2G5EDT9_AQUCA|nr:hypothetical protein AQUCO_00900472v1 [Aquilegia coerulea]
MEGNDCTTVVHPVSDSHYDTILEDEIHIPIDPVENVPKERHYLGKMDVICPSCSAYHWLDERLTKSTKKKSFFGMCCLQGKIKLPLLTPLPSAIKLLYEGRNSLARSFRKNIRSYNAANVFSSLGVSMDKRILKGRGPTSFTIHGQLSHQIGSLLPESDKSPSYSQLYIYDPHIALECRQKRNLHLNPAILKIIQEALLESNELCKIYKGVYDVLKSANSNGGESIPIRLAYTPTIDPRRYNLPTSEDIAVIIPGDETEPTSKRDIILHLKNNNLQRISECHPLYLPSHYVLLFPTGDLGWSTDMKHLDVKNERTTEYSALFRAGLLFQQFIVDAWASYEQNRLYWIRTHQADLRCDVYSGLTDIVTNGHNPNDIGKKFILPSTHLGSPRHIYEIYQDSMAITRYYKHLDIFMPVTSNPKWPEIQNELKPGQAALDRPDLVARVFELKRKAIMHEIENKRLFGRVVAKVYTIEFQKRGLPHMHALFFLHPEDKIRTTDQVNRIVSAEFPDPIKHPALFETIKKCMVHGPCGTRNMESVCMENKVCKSRYLRENVNDTRIDVDGYPIYRRRKTGKSYHVRGHLVDNKDVVPYNPHLSKMFDCHINVEICASVRAVKYIHKYIYKGHDRTTMVVGAEDDEIPQYLDARYVGPTEAAWRLYGFRIHEELPCVTRLALHLKGMHVCVFNPNDTPEQVKEKAENQKSSLTAYFDWYEKNPTTKAYTYQQFPEQFRWCKDNKKWTPRVTSAFSIGRMHFANPNSGERFYLRLLLTVVKGPSSFESLYSVDGIEHKTYRETCIARGLLENDNEWDKCLEEAVIIKTGHQVRRLFCLILTECNPSRPEILWEKNALKICDDLPYQLKTKFGIQDPSDSDVCDYGLFLMNDYLLESGKTLSDFPNMPLPCKTWNEVVTNCLITEHQNFVYQGLYEKAQEKVARFNTEQLNAYTEITNSVRNDSRQVFFLSGPAGTGKTFVYNTVADTLRSEGHIVIMVASLGIASLLLTGGRTAHSTFKIPFEVLDDSVCSVTKQTIHAELFKRAKLIIWDEVPMEHRFCVEAIDRTLRDIREIKEPFGGVTVVLGGDFKQTLLVITKGTRQEIVRACLTKSHLWSGVRLLTLVKNMRLNSNDIENVKFADYLIEIGTNPKEDVELPSEIKRCNSTMDLLFKVYPNLNVEEVATETYLQERSILSARNDDVATLNELAINHFLGEFHEYLAADKAIEDDQPIENRGNSISNENMQALDPPSLPPFKLQLKVGCPIMLLRNLQPRDGLCNGTRLMVVQFATRVIEAKILNGSHAGNYVFIPRITLQPSVSETPFQMARRQFPVRLAFAMTINKSQGQSVKYVGIDLRNHVFSHGQLYVALSRCTSSNRISVLLGNEDDDKTTNVVYPEVLL